MRITFRRSNENSPVLQQLLKILFFLSNALSVHAKHVNSGVIPQNLWNVAANVP
jgi:hypothetical protein